jgi:hypothetical protein
MQRRQEREAKEDAMLDLIWIILIFIGLSTLVRRPTRP